GSDWSRRVLRHVNMLTNERYHVGWAIDPRQAAVEDELGDSRGCLNLDLQNVRLRWKQHAELQLIGSHLIGDGVSRFNEHFIGHSPGIRGVNTNADSGKDIKIVGLRG